MKRKQLLAATASIVALALFPLPPATAAEGAAKVDLVRAKQVADIGLRGLPRRRRQ